MPFSTNSEFIYNIVLERSITGHLYEVAGHVKNRRFGPVIIIIIVVTGRLPSAPMETSFTPLLSMNCSALLTFAILWKRIFPRSGFASCSPEITSSSSISLRPLLKSSSIVSICVPALRRCELHHAVNVCNERRAHTGRIHSRYATK